MGDINDEVMMATVGRNGGRGGVEMSPGSVAVRDMGDMVRRGV
jgi:hypothetical protein